MAMTMTEAAKYLAPQEIKRLFQEVVTKYDDSFKIISVQRTKVPSSRVNVVIELDKGGTQTVSV